MQAITRLASVVLYKWIEAGVCLPRDPKGLGVRTPENLQQHFNGLEVRNASNPDSR